MTISNAPDLRIVRTMPVQKPSKSKQDYETPKEFLDAVEERFGRITFDLAATDQNAKANSWFTPEDNSLVQPWDDINTGGDEPDFAFLNPPFGDIAPWARKCASTRRLKVGFLIPASVGSNYWAESIHGPADLILFLRPRLSFDGKNPYPKDCVFILYNLYSSGRVDSGDTRYECWKGPW